MTRSLISQRDVVNKSELVCLLADGIWTAPRLLHAGYVSSRSCWWRPNGNQTPGHLFWECPRFATIRIELSEPELCLIATHPASYHCGYCLRDFSEALKKRWPLIQRYLSLVIAECNDHYRQLAKERHQHLPPEQIPSLVSGSGRCGRVGPPLPGGEVYAGAGRLDFTCMVGRHTSALLAIHARSMESVALVLDSHYHC